MVQDIYQEKTKQRHHLDDLLFDDVSNIDADQDYWFKLRCSESNRLICAATPLIGLSLRIRKLMLCHNIEELYNQAVEEIKNIEVELAENQYDHAIILAYRYILCTVVDEAVMSTPWGSESYWAENSLLTYFHNETWGGEKVFSILTRLKGDPERYRQLLEFIFICMTLGFEGRYKVMDKGKDEHRKVLLELHALLSDNDEETHSNRKPATHNVMPKNYKVNNRVTPIGVVIGFSFMLLAVYGFYQMSINKNIDSVLLQLSTLL
ncbi:type IVB secretion system protein IcmH/DotU [Enterovibrio sp. ZSDZ35]|uniref:Type IVB secretion system protein IcmH/DotU n=1 Tax=Enterovibrio qingdaonensis TaxID=2899818 RepID=A0ABT5QIR0_9GAMM|nr:type IVB secretion system protein IcmH/DotU [Enterovibrio sp. ZSDZ35]MDD1780509.1 type IVB secretion system protein IcmH/DotU [Enterovibrio sp. ZSDZ35]